MKLQNRIILLIFNFLMVFFILLFFIRSMILKPKRISVEPKEIVEDQKIPFVDIKKIHVKNDKIFCLNETFSSVMIYSSNGIHEKNITLPYYEKGENAIYFLNDIMCLVDRKGNLYEFENEQLKYLIKCDYKNSSINVLKSNGQLVKSYQVDVSEVTPYIYEKGECIVVLDGYKYEFTDDKMRKKEKFDYESIYSKKLTAIDKNFVKYTIKGINPKLIKTTEGKQKVIVKGSWIDWFLYSEKASSILIIGIFTTALFQMILWKIKI